MKKTHSPTSSNLLGSANFFHWSPSLGRSAPTAPLPRGELAKLIYRCKSSLFWSDPRLFASILSSTLLTIFAEEGERLNETVHFAGVDFQATPFRQSFSRSLLHAVKTLPPAPAQVTFRENFIPGLALVLFSKPLEDGFWHRDIINRLFARPGSLADQDPDLDSDLSSDLSASSGTILAVASLIERFTDRTHMKVIVIEAVDALFVFCPSQDLLPKLQQNYFDYSLESLD